jgi:hypothetical protein
VTELILSSGPLRYLGGSIETFALPMGTIIVAAWVLFVIYRRPHNVPRLKYLRPAHQTALGTREPGTEGLVYVASAAAPAAAAAPEAEAEAQTAPEAEAEAPTEAEAPAETEAETETAVEAQAPAETQTDATVEAHAYSAGPETSSAGPEESSDTEHEGTSAEGDTF